MDFPDTNSSLIARIKNPCDAMAWNEFVAIYQPVVYRMARRRSLQDADAQDIAQQVFASVARAIEGWESETREEPFRAWLATIARNALLKFLGRRKPDQASGSSSVVNFLNHQVDDDDEVSQEFLQESRMQVVRWAADQIKDEFSQGTWNLFWESVVVGRSVPDVVAATGKSPGAIYMARFKVLQRLKQKVNEFSPFDELCVKVLE